TELLRAVDDQSFYQTLMCEEVPRFPNHAPSTASGKAWAKVANTGGLCGLWRSNTGRRNHRTSDAMRCLFSSHTYSCSNRSRASLCRPYPSHCPLKAIATTECSEIRCGAHT